MTGTTTPNIKLEVQTDYTTLGTYDYITSSQYITSNHPNMEKQIKVAVFLTEVENNEIISSKFLKEGWIRKPHTNANLDLLAVKRFNLSLNDLDKIVVKEILSINL